MSAVRRRPARRGSAAGRAGDAGRRRRPRSCRSSRRAGGAPRRAAPGAAGHRARRRSPAAPSPRGTTGVRRRGVAVEEVPAADQHRASTTVRPPCASSSPTPPRSRPSTTTSSPPRSRAPARRSSSSPRVFASARRRRPRATCAREVFYPVTSRLFRRSRLRLPLKLLEHPFGMARLAAAPRDVLHVQWLAAPPLDDVLLRPRGPAVFTAHDLLPRRTARREQAVAPAARTASTGSSCTACAARRRSPGSASTARPSPGHPPPRLPQRPAAHRRRAHAPLPGRDPAYKGLGDAIEAAQAHRRRAAARRRRRARAGGALPRGGGRRAEWRLGYLPEGELDRALGDATVALFPYRAELDQSGALLRALGAGVPAVVYDVGGLAEPVRTYGAGRVVAAGDVDGLAAAAASCSTAEALERARAGARRRAPS